jgi:hypothetical protein
MFRVLIALLIVVIGLGFAVSGNAGEKKGGDAGYLKIEAKGKITTGIVAIGGETTGTTITTPGGTFELDLSKNKDLQAQAEKLNGKTGIVTGTLAIRKGVEIRQRFIVTVTTLKAAE